MSRLAQLWNDQFSEEAIVKKATEKRALEILGKPVDQMSDAEVEEKIAEFQRAEAFQKEAQVDYVRGQVMAEGFMDRLKQAGIDLPGMNAKLAALAEKVAPQAS